MWQLVPMNARLSLDEAGRMVLPNSALRLLGMKPGDQVRADRDSAIPMKLPLDSDQCQET